MSVSLKDLIRTLCAAVPGNPQRLPPTNARKLSINVARGLAVIPFAAAVPLVAMAAQASSSQRPQPPSPLVEEVRAATERFRDIRVAMHEGWVAATPCVSGPNEGAMGVHFVQPSRIGDHVLKADEPEALIYEPQRNGSLRLVGVEFISLASDGPAPSLEGHLLNYVGDPNRYGLPAFYEMHVWAWEDNPKGSFADWNTNVSCNSQPLQ